jgi:hypothetical protein
MGKRQFVIPTEKDIQSSSSSKFAIPTEKDLELFSQKKNLNQAGTELSGAKTSMDGAQDDDAWYEKLYSGAIGLGKSIVDAAPTIAKGLARLGATGFSSGVGAPSMNIMAETRGEKVKYKTKEELLTGASETVEDLVPYTKQKLAKGTSSISEIYGKGYLTRGDAENVGYQLGDGLVQMGIGAIPAVGGVLLYSKNFEQRFEDAKAKGISDDKAYNESAVGALVETVIEKNIGVDKLISKGLSKTLSKEAIKDISGALVSKEAFQEVAKKYAKSFSLDNVKQGFVKGFLPEAAEEFAQTYIDGAEQDLFDYYERKRKEDNPNAKLELYDAKDEEGVFNTVNPETGEAELSPSFKSKTLLGALDASFYGGITGQMGGMFVDSRSFNPSIYSTLQNSYDAQGKDGLIKSVETVKQGLTKANQDGKLDVNSYNNALKNVDKIANNVSKFEQKSDINSYSRYLLYDNTERIIPQESDKIARNLAEIMTPLELPTEDQIKNDIDNNEVSPMSFEQAKDIPEAYLDFVTVTENENGERSIQGNVPNSVVKAYNDNQMAVQEAMNNPLFAVQSLTDNNKLVSIEDLERIGQQGGNINKDLAQQLNFKAKFEANKNSFNKGLRVINYAKEVSKGILDGNVVDAEKLRRGYANIFAFNEGDTVFYGNKSAKVLDISPNGQSLKLSGIQERIDASDEMLALEDSVREEMAPVTPVVSEEAPANQEVVAEETPVVLPEEEQITGRTMRDAVDELIPFTYRGETGEIYKQRNGVVVFESPNRIYEFGNINDIGDKSIDEFDIIPQEMEIGEDFSVTIDGKKFTNKSQNPFKAITYDAEGNAVSIKLDNDKGQTRVIKGTRAILIDAKYKIKKLYNDATRDQLAAAADDAAGQAATTTETTGEPGQTTTATEGKPVEQAPSIAQQEYDRRVKEIRAKLAEQESEQATQNRQAIANLASSLYTAGINVEVLDSNAIRAKYGNEVSQGMFLNNKGVIVINESVLPTEWGKTIIFHEGTHPIINIIRNVEPKLYKQLVAAAKEEAKTNPEVNSILQQIRNTKAYGDEFTRNDELVVEIIARVASGKLDLNQAKPSFKQSVVDFINKIAKAMGLNPILKDSDQVALTKLATQISDVLNSGRDISEIVGSSNVGKFSNNTQSQFRDENGNPITVGEAQFRLNNNIKDVDSGLEYTYLKDSDEFKSLVEDGTVTDDKLLKDFNEGYVLLHQPDAAFTGEIRKNGVTLVQGNGGVFYPIRFHKNGYFWASTESTAVAMAKALNENARLNNGRILMALTTAPSDKLLSSTTMASGAMDLFISKAFDKSFDVNKTGIKSAIIAAARYTETKNVGGKQKIVGIGDTNKSLPSLDINSLRDYVRGLLSPDNSSFGDRKTFTIELANQIAKLAKTNPLFEQQLGEFFDVSIDNKVFKGKYASGYKISKSNIIDGLSYLFSEPMLRKTPETIDEKGGNVYAIIEAVGMPGEDLVKAVDSKEHESYPKAIQAVDDSVKIKLHILQDRQKWNQTFEDNTTNAIVTKERESSVFPPSTGVSTGSLRLNAQMSEIDRTDTSEKTVAEESEKIQFSDISRDDKRIQFVRENLKNYSKSEIVDALMGAPFNLTKEKAENIVAQASYDNLAPSLPTDNKDLSIPDGARLNQRSSVVDEYNEGYDKEKKGLLTKASNFWAEKMKYLALQYDSRFFARRKLDVASTEESLAKARLRTLNGIAYAAGQELSKHYNDIFGNGLEAEGERALNSMIFNLRILQIDKNTEQKYQDEIEKLTLEFSDANRRLPSAIESRSIAVQARKNVPVKMHGKTKNNIPATSQTAQAFLEDLRAELGESEYNMLRARAELFRKVNNAQVIKLRDAGLISNEVANTYKDDFYAYRKTLERLYGEQDNNVIMLSGVTSIKGWASLSKEGAENYLEQDARMLLAESYIGTARAIAKNKLREAIYEENIKVDENGREQSIIDKEGRKVEFIKPAKYLRDKNGDIRSNGKELSVSDADEGFVNVPYKKNGVVNYFQMEKEMFDQIEGNNIKWKDAELSGAKSNAYYDTTDFVNRVLTGFATRNNPFFWIGNIPMDLQQQVFFTDIWTQGNPLQSNVYVAGARAIARTIKFTNLFNRNTEFVDNTLAEYIAAGGAMDRMSTMKEQRQRTIELSLFEGDKNKKGEWIKSKFKAFNSKMNEGTEIAMRLAAYDQAKNNLINKFKEDNNGANPSESDMTKIQEIAAAQSRAYTDFAQRGTQIPNLNIAYLNSAIQASGVALEYISDNPAKFANKASQLVIGKFLGTIAIMALMGDAYDELDEYRKDLYSFMFAFDTKIKDDKGNPIFVTADIKNNPQLVPILGVSREAAEMTMKYLRGDEQKDYTAGGTVNRTIELLNHALFGIVPNVTSIEALTKSSAQILAKNTLLNAGIKAFFGYDAFRGREIEKAKDADVSPYMRGQDDKSIPYFYKAMAMSMANNTSVNQVSPAKMQAVAETFITSPSTTPWVGLLYGVLSDVANLIIPAKSQAQKGEYSIADGGNKLLKSLTKKFATYTDAEKAEMRSNDILYKMSREESLRFNDTERKIDIQLRDLYKSDSKNFFENVDKMAKKEGYWDNDLIMNRIDTRARNIDNTEYDRTFIKSDISNEVKILFHTRGADGKAKLLKYMFEKDSTKAREVIDGLIDYGMPAKEAYDTEDLYLNSIK